MLQLRPLRTVEFEHSTPRSDVVCQTTRARNAYQVSLVAEEIEAWKRGRRLANRLGLYINDKKFNNVMSECVMTYIADAAVIVR